MYVDRDDYDHLVNQLNKDVPLLVRKINDMRNTLYKELNKRKLYEPKLNVKKWRNHITNVSWVIYYNVTKENGKNLIQFVPITSFNDKDGTISYFVLCLEVLNPNSEEKHLFKVFRGHFITQYLKRTESSLKDPYLTVIDFITSQDLTINHSYKQNEKWKMFLEAKGVAMVREDRLCLVFDTFVLLSDLFPDQEKAIRDYIDYMLINNPEDFFISFLVLFKRGTRWNKFITDEVIMNAVKSTYAKNPELARAVVKQLLINSGMS